MTFVKSRIIQSEFGTSFSDDIANRLKKSIDWMNEFNLQQVEVSVDPGSIEKDRLGEKIPEEKITHTMRESRKLELFETEKEIRQIENPNSTSDTIIAFGGMGSHHLLLRLQKDDVNKHYLLIVQANDEQIVNTIFSFFKLVLDMQKLEDVLVLFRENRANDETVSVLSELVSFNSHLALEEEVAGIFEDILTGVNENLVEEVLLALLVTPNLEFVTRFRGAIQRWLEQSENEDLSAFAKGIENRLGKITEN